MPCIKYMEEKLLLHFCQELGIFLSMINSSIPLFEDLSNVLETTVISSHELVILGDFNIRTDLQDTVEARTYSNFLPLQSEKPCNLPNTQQGPYS